MQQIKDVMTRGVQVINPETPIAEAARRMRDGDFGLLPIGEDDRMVGTISDRDIVLRAVAEDKDGSAPVRDVMTSGIHWVYEDDSVDKAAALMAEHQVRRLPVVNRDKRLVGIVSLGDFAVDVGALKPAAKALSEISQPA
jgi:CBS domain-containing protein